METLSNAVVTVEKEEQITIIRLNRPEKLNAFNRAMYRELNEAVNQFNNDSNSKVAIITGTGRAFSAGVDVNDLLAAANEEEQFDPNEIAGKFSVELEDLEFAEKPVIAAINGLCYGEGLSLAMACDLRVATSDALFCMPEVKIGIASVHGTLRMVHNLGLGNALEMTMLGEPVDADWALRTGLINKQVSAEELLPSALVWAQTIAKLDAAAVKGTREVAVKCQFLDFNDTVDLGSRLRNEKFANGHKPSLKA